MSVEAGDQIRVSSLHHPEDERDPRVERTEEQLDRILGRFKESGWISPIIFTADDMLIVDGNTRVQALEELDEEIRLQVLGEFQGFVYAIPDTELEIGPEEASAELNIFRENLSEPDRADFLDYLVQTRVINNGNVRVARDAGEEISTGGLLRDLENDEREDRAYSWTHSDEARETLLELLAGLDFDSPGRARNILRTYQSAPDRVKKLWIRDELYGGHVEELTRIHEKLAEGADLSQSSTAQRGYSFDDLIEYSRMEYEDEESYYSREDLRDIYAELDETPDEPETDGFEEFVEEEVSEEDEQLVERIADHNENITKERVLEESYQEHQEGKNFREELQKTVDEIEDHEEKQRQVMEERWQERESLLDDFAFERDSKYATGEANHLAPPVETDNFGVFFHDVKDLDDEIDDGEVDLIFTSPPYFTQKDRIVEEWWPEDLEYEDENITREHVDDVYNNYLEDMEAIFTLLKQKLAEGRYMIVNISDTMAYDLDQIYDIPSDFSHMLRNELDLTYDTTITWDKGKGQTNDRARTFYGVSNAGGKPGAYHPNWRCEHLLVFSKGDPSIDTDFRHEDKTVLQPLSDDLWQIDNETPNAEHEAGFTVDLPIAVLQLYSAPGDTVLDPFGGHSRTLLAAKVLNDHFSDEPDWKGFAFENFVSETADQDDYWRETKRIIEGGLGIYSLRPYEFLK